MKTKMLTAALCVALLAIAVPAAASARKATYTGSLKNGGTVSITAKQKAKRGPIRIGTIRLRGVTANCQGQVAPLGYTTIGSFGLGRDLKFDFNISDKAGAKLQMAAKLSHKAKNFHGYIRLYGSFPFPDGSTKKCETGQEAFVAKP